MIDVQADLLASLATRIVVPMIARKRYTKKPFTRLMPAAIRGVEYLLIVPDLASVPSNTLGEVVASLASHRDDIAAALDLALTGV